MDIQNVELTFTDSCIEEHKELIKFYWKFKPDILEFDNTPTYVKNKYKIQSLTKLSQMVASGSRLTFYLHCVHCNSYEENDASSHTNFKTITKKSNYGKAGFKCGYCKNRETKEIKKQESRKIAATIERLEKAVDIKQWESLTDFQYELLNRCLTTDFNKIKRHYWNELGKNQYPRLFKELQTLADLDLLIVHRNASDDRVSNYQYCSRLLNEFVYVPRMTNTNNEFKAINGTTNQLKFRLTLNKGSHHPDSPKYAGIITFKERIVIEPNVEYTFAQWERAGDNLYLTLIPTEEVYPAPNQLPISKLPTSLQDGIQSFLRSIKPF